MRAHLAILLLGWAACEQVSPPSPSPPVKAAVIVPPAPAPVAPPPAPVSPPVLPPAPAPAIQPPQVLPVPPVTVPKVKGRLRDEDKLPKPPSPDDPVAYQTWAQNLSAQDRADVGVFCRARPNMWSYHEVCGGIGPYHIPVPPSLARAAGPNGGDPFVEHEAWLKALTKDQRTYYEYWCVKNSDEGEIGYSQLCGGTPLVVSFDPASPVVFTTDHVGVSPATPWLALDRDGNGTIDGAAELFGDDTLLPDGTRATNGFAALAPLDTNGDGVIDRADAQFAALVVWSDRDGDGRATAGEVSPLAASGVTSIALANTRVPRCTELACEGERSTMTFADPITGDRRTGAVIDVYFKRAALARYR